MNVQHHYCKGKKKKLKLKKKSKLKQNYKTFFLQRKDYSKYNKKKQIVYFIERRLSVINFSSAEILYFVFFIMNNQSIMILMTEKKN